MRIVVDDLSGTAIAEFLDAHLRQMRGVTPLESKHALDLDALRGPEVTFWTALDGASILGCGAIKRLDDAHGEIKSMRTAPTRRQQGIGARLLTHMLTEARRMGFSRLSLETGSTDFFAPARQLYLRHGFVYCGPFAHYADDSNSVFMTRELNAAGESGRGWASPLR